MGQYYRAVDIDKMQGVSPHSGGSGIKLMEHSYVGNGFMEKIEVLLSPFGPWHKDRIVWAGDYADDELDDGHSIGGNLYSLTTDLELAPYEIDQLAEKNGFKSEDYKYIVNHSKQSYVDKTKAAKFNCEKTDKGEDCWQIHPLSLLTADGNGRGGGDYYDNFPDIDMVGQWARDSISVEKEPPEGYVEIEVGFSEER